MRIAGACEAAHRRVHASAAVLAATAIVAGGAAPGASRAVGPGARAARAVAAVAADTCVPTAPKLAGSYKLAQLNGGALPATYADATGKQRTVAKGSLELYDNGSWVLKLTLHAGATTAGKKTSYLDMGNSTRSGDALAMKPIINPAFTASARPCVLDVSYDIDTDKVPERLTFAKPGAPLGVASAPGTPTSGGQMPGSQMPGQMPGAAPTTAGGMPTAGAPASGGMPQSGGTPSSGGMPAAGAPSSGGMPSGGMPTAGTPTGGMPPAGQPPTPPPASGSMPNAGEPSGGAPPFDLVGAYTAPAELNTTTLQINAGRSWELHFSTPTSAPGFGGFRFWGDKGTLVQSGSAVHFRSAENGDFEGLASGKGTLVVDYYIGSDSTPRRWRFVKNGVAENPKTAPGPNRTGRGAAAPAAASSVKWAAVSAGAFYACGLTTAGAAYCWGLRAQPDGSAGGLRPAPVPGGLSFAQISAGSHIKCDPNRPEESCPNSTAYHSCALTAAGAAYCWGVNQFGQLGDGSTNDSATPVKVAGGLTFASISAGEAVTCGVTTGRALYCWGKNEHGELGIGSRDNDPHPTPKAVASNVRAVSAGSGLVCALQGDGTAYCWGNGNSDRIGTEEAISYNDNPSPLRVQSNNRYVAISAGRTHVCAVAASGAADCWGDNYYGESGPGRPQPPFTRIPAPVGRVSLTSVSTGMGFHTCGLGADGAAYCWGRNESGRLGIGDGSPEPCGYGGSEGCSHAPVAVKGGLRFTTVSAGQDFACGITADGAAYCWGSNARGQLGTGDKTPRTTPARVAAPVQ